ncbi:FAD-dependent monooxygenase [Microbispora sp. NPDC049125]|uniref:FAD-dependent monooxygenase n=1 Tax=Microbispora sp. NPDC049125 TaxID=3154929 RepID=UPI0034657827
MLMTEPMDAQVCVVGAGPGGLALAVELTRAGVDVVVVEQTGHFNRSFRGESISPDGVYLLDRLGVLKEIIEEGAMETRRLEIVDGGRTVLDADFDRFDDYEYRYPMEVPQPTLLKALADAAGTTGRFRMVRRSKAAALLEEGGRITGVSCSTPDGPLEVRARLTVAADGRYSKVREMAGLDARKLPLDRDVIWFKVPAPAGWDVLTYRIRIRADKHALFIPTFPNMVRVGVNIPKDGLRDVRRLGIGFLHSHVRELAPEMAPVVVEHVPDWSHTSVLDIFTSTAPRWSRPGLVLMGDAAHTLSPILGQGVNHALIDAVTLAPLVAAAFERPAAERDRALGDAADRFQAVREPSVARSRRIQLRQEKLFTFGSRPGGWLRQGLYRAMNSSTPLTRFILGKAYFQVQPRRSARDRVPVRNASGVRHVI